VGNKVAKEVSEAGTTAEKIRAEWQAREKSAGPRLCGRPSNHCLGSIAKLPTTKSGGLLGEKIRGRAGGGCSRRGLSFEVQGAGR